MIAKLLGFFPEKKPSNLAEKINVVFF